MQKVTEWVEATIGLEKADLVKKKLGKSEIVIDIKDEGKLKKR